MIVDFATVEFGTITTLFESRRTRVERQPTSTTKPSSVSPIFT